MIVAYYRWAKDLRKCWIGYEQIVVAIQNNEKSIKRAELCKHYKCPKISKYSNQWQAELTVIFWNIVIWNDDNWHWQLWYYLSIWKA